MHAEVDSAGVGADLRQAEGAEARVDRVVGIASGPHTNDLRIERLGALLDHDPLLVLFVFRIELHVLHPYLGEAERRRDAHDIHGNAERHAILRGVVGLVLIVPHLVGEYDDHDVLFRGRRAENAGRLGRAADRGERVFRSTRIDGDRFDRLHDLLDLVGRLGRDERHALTEADNHVGQVGAAGRRAVGTEFVEHAVETVGDLPPLRRQAHRLVEHPADDRRPLGEGGGDLGGEVVDGSRGTRRPDADGPLHRHRGIDLLRRGQIVDHLQGDVAREVRLGLDRHHGDLREGRRECLGHRVALLALRTVGFLPFVGDRDLLRHELHLFLGGERGLDDGHVANRLRRLSEAGKRQPQEHDHMDRETHGPGRRVAIERTVLIGEDVAPPRLCSLHQIHRRGGTR